MRVGTPHQRVHYAHTCELLILLHYSSHFLMRCRSRAAVKLLLMKGLFLEPFFFEEFKEYEQSLFAMWSVQKWDLSCCIVH